MPDDDRYEDPGLAVQDNPGEISAAAIDRLHAMITQAMRERDAFARWFGHYSSTPKYAEADWSPEAPIDIEALRASLAEGLPLHRNPASRFSFIRQAGGAVLLFVDGDCFECAGETATLAALICARDRIAVDPALMTSDDAMTLLATLFDRGAVAFEAED